MLMDHPYLEENQVPERYLQGRLSAAESASFEEHYLTCPRCLDHLQLSERFDQAMKGVAGEEVARAVVRRVGIVAWLVRLSRSRQISLGVTLLLLLTVLPISLSVQRINRLDVELGKTQASLDEWQKREAGLQSEVEAARDELAKQRLQLEHGRQGSGPEALEPGRGPQPRVEIPLLRLSQPRSSPGLGAPASRLKVPDGVGWLGLALELEQPDHPRYRVTLVNPQQEVTWQQADLKPDDSGLLVMVVPSSYFEPGDLVLRLEAFPVGGGAPISLSPFALRVMP